MEVDYPPSQICMDQSSKGNVESTPDTDHSYSSALVDDSRVDESCDDYSIKPNSQSNVHLQGKLEMDGGDNLCQENIESETGLYTEATIVISKPTEDGRIKTQEERLGTAEKCADKGNALSHNWGQIHIIKENNDHSIQNSREAHPHSVDPIDTSENLIKVVNSGNSAIKVIELEPEHCYGKNSRDYHQENRTNQNVEGSDDIDIEINVEIGVEEVEVNTLEDVDEGSGMDVEGENEVLIEPEEVEVSAKAEVGKRDTPGRTSQTLKAVATPFQRSETNSSDADRRILALVIHSLENESLADHFLYSFMTVKVHLVNGITGKPMQCQNGEMVLPRTTKPWDFKVNRTKTAVWEELCLFKESYSYVMEEKHQAVFLFEVMDASSWNTANMMNRLEVAGEGRVIAWGFLPLTNSKGKERKWLQLYWPQKKTLTKQGEIEVFHWYKSKQERCVYPASLTVSVNGVIPRNHLKPSCSNLPLSRENIPEVKRRKKKEKTQTPILSQEAYSLLKQSPSKSVYILNVAGSGGIVPLGTKGAPNPMPVALAKTSYPEYQGGRGAELPKNVTASSPPPPPVVPVAAPPVVPMATPPPVVSMATSPSAIQTYDGGGVSQGVKDEPPCQLVVPSNTLDVNNKVMDDKVEPQRLHHSADNPDSLLQQPVRTETSPTAADPSGQTNMILKEENSHGDTPKDWSPISDSAVHLTNQIKTVVSNTPIFGEEMASDLGPVGTFLFSIGMDLVKERASKGLIRLQTKKLEEKKLDEKEKEQLEQLRKFYSDTRQKNCQLHLKKQKCRKCKFKTESLNVMENHLEYPHMQGTYMNCSFCNYGTSQSLTSAFTQHVKKKHKKQPRAMPKSAPHQCPLCSYDNIHSLRVSQHLALCRKTFNFSKNLAPEPNFLHHSLSLDFIKKPKAYQSSSAPHRDPNQMSIQPRISNKSCLKKSKTVKEQLSGVAVSNKCQSSNVAFKSLGSQPNKTNVFFNSKVSSTQDNNGCFTVLQFKKTTPTLQQMNVNTAKLLKYQIGPAVGMINSVAPSIQQISTSQPSSQSGVPLTSGTSGSIGMPVGIIRAIINPAAGMQPIGPGLQVFKINNQLFTSTGKSLIPVKTAAPVGIIKLSDPQTATTASGALSIVQGAQVHGNPNTQNPNPSGVASTTVQPRLPAINIQSVVPPKGIQLKLPPTNIQSVVPPTNIQSVAPPTNIQSVVPPTKIQLMEEPTNIQPVVLPTSIQLKVPSTNIQSVVPTSIQLKVPPTNIQSLVPPTSIQMKVPSTNIQSVVPTSNKLKVPPTNIQSVVPPTSTKSVVSPTSIQPRGEPTSMQSVVPPTTTKSVVSPTSIQPRGIPTSMQSVVPQTSTQSVVSPTSFQLKEAPTSIQPKAPPKFIYVQPEVLATHAASLKRPSSVENSQDAGSQKCARLDQEYIVCELCDGYVKNRDALRLHFRNVHQIEIFPKKIIKCAICNYSFWTSSGWKKHIKNAHAQNGCYLCKESWSGDLVSHLLTAHGVNYQDVLKLNKCVGCGQEFYAEKQLEAHMTVYHGLDWWEMNLNATKMKRNCCSIRSQAEHLAQQGCKHCGIEAFSDIQHYCQHFEFTHRGFTCSHCVIKLPSVHALGMHLFKSHQVKLFMCDRCWFRTSYEHTLQQHIVSCQKKTVQTLVPIGGIGRSSHLRLLPLHHRKCEVRVTRLTRDEIAKYTSRL